MRAFPFLLAMLLLECWAADRAKIVFISGEYEYSSRETLSQFAKDLEKHYDFEKVILQRPSDPKVHSIGGLEALREADLAVFFIRRMTLSAVELDEIKNYLASGKPLLGLRTSSHAFENWKEFDKEVLGGNYGNHYGNKLKTTVSLLPEANDHPILNGVTSFISEGSLYKNTPIQPGVKQLLLGKVEGHAPEPVAWTHQYKGTRVFYTSLGHPNDFKEPSFQRLLRNAIEWTLQQPLKNRKPTP